MTTRAKTIARVHAPHVIAGLRHHFAAPEYRLLTEVRSENGIPESWRQADAIAVRVQGDGSLELDFVEVKCSRADWKIDRDDEQKSAPFRRYCRRMWLAVQAPWKRIVLTARELPGMWGLLEVDGRRVRVVEPAGENTGAEDPMHAPDLLRAMFAASGRAEDRAIAEAARGGQLAPLKMIDRPHLSRAHVGLVCGHAAVRPGDKVLPPRVACWGCAEGRPADLEVVLAMAEDLPEEQLEQLRQVVNEKVRRTA